MNDPVSSHFTFLFTFNGWVFDKSTNQASWNSRGRNQFSDDKVKLKDVARDKKEAKNPYKLHGNNKTFLSSKVQRLKQMQEVPKVYGSIHRSWEDQGRTLGRTYRGFFLSEKDKRPGI